MADKYYSIITNTGKALEAAAIANGTTITLSHFVVGDGNGKELVPDATSTKLVNEKYRQKIAMLTVSPDQANQLMAQLVIPSEIGGFTVREIGLLTDKGELYALANCAAIEKPVGGINISMQFRLAVSDTANITLQVATGDGLFLRMDRNLSDVKDVATARGNLGLKAAALRDVGTDAGQVMPVGAFGVGGDAPKLSNPSGIKYSGFSSYGGNTDPSLRDWGSLISSYYGESSEYCGQLYIPSDQREALIRFMKNGKVAWSSKLYHEGNKPTAADVGAFNKSEAEQKFLFKSGDYLSGQITSNVSDNYRIVANNIGQFWRMDGSSFYLLLTNPGDPMGSWNSLRPFVVNAKTGSVIMNHRVDIADLHSGGATFHSDGNISGPAWGDHLFGYIDRLKNSSGSGWWRCGTTGLIIQWGVVGAANDFLVNFPITFPRFCVSVQMTQNSSYYGGNSAANISASNKNNSGFFSNISRYEVGADWLAIGF